MYNVCRSDANQSSFTSRRWLWRLRFVSPHYTINISECHTRTVLFSTPSGRINENFIDYEKQKEEYSGKIIQTDNSLVISFSYGFNNWLIDVNLRIERRITREHTSVHAHTHTHRERDALIFLHRYILSSHLHSGSGFRHLITSSSIWHLKILTFHRYLSRLCTRRIIFSFLFCWNKCDVFYVSQHWYCLFVQGLLVLMLLLLIELMGKKRDWCR